MRLCNICKIYFIFCYRSETVHQQRTRSSRLLLSSVDSEDGIGMVDDDMEALLPNNRGLSDDLSHVSTFLHIQNIHYIIGVKYSACLFIYTEKLIKCITAKVLSFPI